MQVKRFVAADMRRALEMVREEIGPDAIIMSSQRHKDGVEILTAVEDMPQVPDAKKPLATDASVATGYEAPMDSDGAWASQSIVDEALMQHRDLASSSRPVTAEQVHQFGAASGKTSRQLADDIEQARQRMLAAKRREEKDSADHQTTFQQAMSASASAITERAPKQSAASAASRYSIDDTPVDNGHENVKEEQLKQLQSELADMRELLEQQLGAMSWGSMSAASPVQATLWRRLNTMGLPADVINKTVAQLPHSGSIKALWPQALAHVSQALPVHQQDCIDQGGVFAFVGPTGVGKTTTIAKLAARYVLKHGADSVALITTDTYRIAAHDQLRSLGKILNVTVKVVDDNHSLPSVLKGLQQHSLVLIDTAGFRCGDPQLQEQLDVLSVCPNVESFLVLSCCSQKQMMKAAVHAYNSAGLSGCILTKIDESASLGEALGVASEHKLSIAYTTDGQEIPKDISVAKAHQLIAAAVQLSKTQPVDEQQLLHNFSSVSKPTATSARQTAEHLY